MSAELASRVDAFLAHLRVERRYSPSTIDHYGRALATLLEFAESRALARWRDLLPAEVQGLLASEHRRGLAPASLRSLASAWRSFWKIVAEAMRLLSKRAYCSRTGVTAARDWASCAAASCHCPARVRITVRGSAS